MSLVRADRVLEVTTTTGTGPLTLGGPVTGYRSFASVMLTSDTCYYVIQAIDGSGIPTGDWEVGLGTYSALNTLNRTTILSSSNAGGVVDLQAGAKQVFITATAEELISIFNGSESYTHTQSSASATWTINHNMGIRPVIAIINTGGNEVEAHIVHTSATQAMAYFSTPVAGIARCVAQSGPQGIAGPAGATGATGPAGPTGATGATGMFSGSEAIITSLASNDYLFLTDTSDSNNPKRITAGNALLSAKNISMVFSANGDAYVVAHESMTIGSARERGTGTVAYATSTDGVTFSSGSLPLTLAANDVLKVSVTSISVYKAITLERTA